MLTHIARTAGFSGLLAAILLTFLQMFWVTPLILEAETYEDAAPVHEQLVDATDHHHGEAWSPADGFERTAFTGLANLVAAVGFAAILTAVFLLRAPASLTHGLLWGLAGFVTFNLAPALGLPPEVPGAAAAELQLRQYWWIATAAATAGGLALLVFSRNWALKLVGLVLLAVPHLLGAPQPESHESLAPQALASEFIYASLITNALFWCALGLLSAWLFRRGAAHSG